MHIHLLGVDITCINKRVKRCQKQFLITMSVSDVFQLAGNAIQVTNVVIMTPFGNVATCFLITFGLLFIFISILFVLGKTTKNN